jgi:steroid delta-isomerase-like uncharacterized protein
MEQNSNTLEENKKIARLAFEAFEKRDLGLLSKITDPSYKLHFPGQPEPLNYLYAKKLQDEYSNAFPDMKIVVENQIAEGDFVATRVTYKGIHDGELQGVPPTGKKINTTGMSLHKIKNGKITDEWVEFDSLGQMQQIGVISEMVNDF